MFGFGSPRNSGARSPRATRSPRASRTYFGFGGSKAAAEEAEGGKGAAAAAAAEAEPAGRKSWISGISSSIRSMSPRASRSPRSQRKSTDMSAEEKKPAAASGGGSAPPSKAAAPKVDTSSSPPAAAAATPKTEASGEAKYLRPHLRVGDALNGRYQIMHDISTGSFGHVIACSDLKQNGRTVAVKVQDRVEAKYHKGTATSHEPSQPPPPISLSQPVSSTTVGRLTPHPVARFGLLLQISRSKSTFWRW